jgi:glycosyltransferase involved in cell wall biosynthesis
LVMVTGMSAVPGERPPIPAPHSPSRQSLRLLYVAEAFGSGVFELLRLVTARAAAEGHEIAIAYGFRPETPARPADYFDPRVTLAPMPWTSRTPWAELRAIRSLRRFALNWDPDIAHLYSSFAGVVGLIALPRRVPTVYSPQAYAFTMTTLSGPRRRAYRAVEGLISRRVSVVGASSESEAIQAREELGAKRVEVIANGIPELDEIPLRQSLHLRRDDRPSVVAIGRLVAQRQPEACARIMKPLRNIAELRWVGGAGSQERNIVEHLAAAGVTMTGWLSHEHALDRLSEATAYLHWSAGDGLPLSVLEALARDVAVVASDIPVNRELLGADQTFTREQDATAMLHKLITDRVFREEILARQRARRSRWGADRMTLSWLQLYERLAAVPSGG